MENLLHRFSGIVTRKVIYVFLVVVAFGILRGCVKGEVIKADSIPDTKSADNTKKG